MDQSDNSELTIKLNGLEVQISERLAQEIVSAAVKAYARTDQPLPDELKNEINRWVRIPRVAIDKANPGQIRRALLNMWYEHEELKVAVLNAWASQHMPLMDVCKEWIEQNPSEDIDVISVLSKISNIGSEEQIQLAFCLAKHNEVSANIKEINNTVDAIQPMHELISKQSKRTELLSLLGELPAEDNFWSEVEDFIHEISKIAADKLQAQQRSTKLHQLQTILDQYQTKFEEKASDLQIEGYFNWKAEGFPSSDVNEIVQKVEALHTLLEELERLENEPRVSTRSERKQWIDQIQNVEEQFVNAFVAIQSLYVYPDQSEELPAKIQPEILSIDDETNPVNDIIELPTIPENIGGNETAIPENEDSIKPPSIDTGSSESFPEKEYQPYPGTSESTHPTNLVEDSSIEGLFSDEVDDLPEPYLEEPEIIEDELVGDEIDLDIEADIAIPVQLIYVDKESTESVTAPLNLDRVNAELIRRISQENLSHAYWIAWGIEHTQQRPALPSWLLAVAQGVAWSIAQWPEQSSNLLDSIRELEISDPELFEVSEGHGVWGLLGAGLYLNLFDADGPWSGWTELAPTRGLPHLRELAESITSIVQRGVSLDPVSVQLVANAEEAERHIQNMATDAKHWLQSARTRTSKILRSTQVWQEMVRAPKGELYQLVEPVAADQRSHAEVTLRRLENWQNQSWLNKQIQKLDQQLLQRKSRPIDGDARNQIYNWVKDICDLVEQWAIAVKHSEEAKQGRNWGMEQIRELSENLLHSLPLIHDELQELRISSSDQILEASTEILERTLQGLQTILSSDATEKLAKLPQPPALLSFNSTQPRLVRRMASVLYYYPELNFEPDGTPDPTQADELISVLETTADRPIDEVINGWLEARDYRFISVLTSNLPNRELWDARSREAIRRAVANLEQDYIDKTAIEVEQALLEGLIAEGEHTEYRSRIESIKRQAWRIDLESINGGPLHHLELRLQEMRSELRDKRRERLSNYRIHWKSIEEQLTRFTGNDEALRAKIISVVEKSLQDEDLRSTSEYLDHLDGALTGERKQIKSLFEGPQSLEPDVLVEFQDILPGLVSLLEPRSPMNLGRIRESILRDDIIPNLPMQSLPKPRRDEVARALDAWRRLKSNGAEYGSGSLSYVANLMAYLGFILIGNSPISVKTLPEVLPNFQYWRVAATSGDFAPVAQFGSQRKGYYDVIGVWDRPGIDVIGSQVSSLMQHTGNQPTILLYFHYLTPSRREQLLNTTHKYNLPMLLIDEAVILSLARLHGSRLPSMFKTTLPYAALNPYFPAAAGLVPPEVFKGRRELVRKLTDFYGPAIVYGGRQLGKSALLRQVQREFHRPENGQYVIYEDIKVIGDPASGKDYKDALRDRLVQALLHLKILEPQRSNLDFDKVLSLLHQNLLEKNRKMLLLLDEADHFLDADASRNFYVIQKLKNLMDDSGRQFKIVLAGLHNVQRFQHISNQPLAHLDTPVEIGPLDPESARDLLVAPLHALGYRFGQDPKQEDLNLVLHILSYTNYHPGLIQLFGSYLVEHLQTKHQKSSRPPLTITRDDIQSVYRNNKLREAIYDRFNWTLALDPRYEVITRALILEQWQDLNGFDRTYTAKQLRDIAESWWPVGFGGDVTPDRFKGFLDEMRGLGVLSVSSAGTYRLRSPNLVALMGTREEIENRMETIIQSAPPGELALESYHARLEESDNYSPLTFAQEQTLNNIRSGVVLFFGSTALGFNNLDQALQRLLPKQSSAWQELKIVSRTREAIHQQLSNFVRENSGTTTLVAFRELEGDPQELAEQVRSAIDFCRKLDRKRALRVCFGLRPQAAWQWFNLSKDERERIEDECETTMNLKRWDQLGIWQRLELPGDSIVPDRLPPKVMNATGGWPILLDEFIKLRGEMDQDKAIEKLRQDLNLQENPIRRSFSSALGIYDQLPRRLIEILRREDVKALIKEETSYLDVLSLMLEDQEIEVIENIEEYLERMGVIKLEPHLAIEPVVDRLWHES